MVSVLTSFASPVVRHAWTGCSGLRQQEAWPGANGEGVCVKPVTLTDDTQLTLLASDTCTHTLSPFLFCSAWVTLPFNISFLFFKLWLWRYRYLLPDFTFRKYIQFTFKIYNGKNGIWVSEREHILLRRLGFIMLFSRRKTLAPRRVHLLKCVSTCIYSRAIKFCQITLNGVMSGTSSVFCS